MSRLRGFARLLARCVTSPWDALDTIHRQGAGAMAACHPSTRVSGRGRLLFSTEVLVGRRTMVHTGSHGVFQMDEGAWLGNDCEVAVLNRIRVGQGSSIQHRSQLHGDVDIGAGCVCAANLYAASTSHRFRDTPPLPLRWQDADLGKLPAGQVSRKVTVEDDCWLGINVVICPGVTVGRGAVVGANSVVTHDVAPYTVVAGTPAREISQRLQYCPSVSIQATRIEDIPYFYSGFRLPSPGSASWSEVVEGGREAGDRFALSMRAQTGDALTLLLSVSGGACRVRHGNQMQFVEPGVSGVSFEASPDRRGLLWFEVEGWVPGGIRMMAATMGAATDA